MFRTFKCSLEYVEADPKPGKSVVISKVVHLLEVTDYELKKKKFLERSSQLIDKGQIKQLVNLPFGIDLERSKISNVTFLKARLRLYDADLKDAELKVNELGVLSSFIHGSKDMDQSLENAIKLKINEVWTQLEESCA